MNILKQSLKINNDVERLWSKVSDIRPLTYSYARHENVPLKIDHNFENKSAKINLFHDGDYFTERITVNPKSKILEIDVVEDQAGPMKYARGYIGLMDDGDGFTTIDIEITYDEEFGPLGPLLHQSIENANIPEMNQMLNIEPRYNNKFRALYHSEDQLQGHIHS